MPVLESDLHTQLPNVQPLPQPLCAAGKAALNLLPGAWASPGLSRMDMSVLETGSLLCVLTNPELAALCSQQRCQNNIKPILVIMNLQDFGICG